MNRNRNSFVACLFLFRRGYPNTPLLRSAIDSQCRASQIVHGQKYANACPLEASAVCFNYLFISCPPVFLLCCSFGQTSQETCAIILTKQSEAKQSNSTGRQNRFEDRTTFSSHGTCDCRRSLFPVLGTDGSNKRATDNISLYCICLGAFLLVRRSSFAFYSVFLFCCAYFRQSTEKCMT